MSITCCIKASASNSDYWNLYASYGAPSNSRKTVDYGTVTGLFPSNGDTGISFVLTNYTTSGTPCYALRRITTYGVSAGDNAYLDGSYTSDTAHFASNWYSKCGGTVNFRIDGYNFATSGYDSMSGYAY